MSKLSNRKDVSRLAFMLMFAYMVSYVTRINYGAIISEIESATGIERSLLSMALTGSFITYGVGQIFSGMIGDRYSPKKIVAVGFSATVIMNLLIPVCKDPYSMLLVWCCNGFAQSLMWPPMVRLMTTLLTAEDYKKTTVVVSWGSSVGTIAVYLISPLIISLFGWRSVFLFSALCGITMLVIWIKCIPDVENAQAHEKVKKGSAFGILFSPLMLCVMLAIILQGMLRDGVTTWMPSYISETYNVSNIISILTGVVMPIFSILSFQVTSMLYNRVFKNPVLCAGVIFGVGALSAFCLCLCTGNSAGLSVFFSALLTGCMHGVNLMLICMVPAAFAKYGSVSTVSGVLNSCTYIGSAISTYGIALLSQSSGWGVTVLLWGVIALAGTSVCLACARPWNKL